MSMTGLARPQAQSLLGRFLFSGWSEHEKHVSVLSGGERRRLSLAVVVASGANLLVLDEPTNHLDLESREALEAALEAFPGTILLVSHDRALLDAVSPAHCRDRVAVAPQLRRRLGRPRAHAGGAVGAGAGSCVASRGEADGEAERPTPKKRTRRGPSELERTEARITQLEQHVEQLEAKLAEDWTDMDVLTAHRAARDELQALLARWEELFDEAQAPAGDGDGP